MCYYFQTGAPWWKTETHHAQALRGSALHSSEDLTEAAHSSRQVAFGETERRQGGNDDQLKCVGFIFWNNAARKLKFYNLSFM